MRKLARKGWVAYGLAVIEKGLPIGAAVVVATLAENPAEWAQKLPEFMKAPIVGTVAWSIAGALLLWLILDICHIASFLLYYDTEGVWIRSGILPGTGGRSGLRWQDLEGVTYRPSVLGFFTNSYTIALMSKFKDAPRFMTHTFAGGRISGQINSQIRGGR